MIETLLSQFAAACANSGNFFGFPYWYRYLKVQDVTHIINGKAVTSCEVVGFKITDIPLVGLALADIALRIAALVAVTYVIYGGVQFVIAQGETDKTKKARQTIINAIIGLVIALMAAGLVAFIGARVGQ